MKRLFYLLTTIMVLLGTVSVIPASASAADNNAEKAKVAAVVEKYSKRDGFESTKFGSVATAAMRSMMKLSVKGQDQSARKTMKVFDGVKTILILDYSDCPSSAKANFEREFKTAVSGYETLIEAKDGKEKMTIYALINQKKSEVVQFIMKTDDTAIIMDGSIDLSVLMDATKQIK